MHLSFLDAWEGRNRTVPECPVCKNTRSRYSRRRYEGVATWFFNVRPVKCLVCGGYFSMAPRGVNWQNLDAAELKIPFRPAELDARRGRDSAEIKPRAPAKGLLARFEKRCPDCGSDDIHPSWTDMQRSIFRLDAKAAFRCSECNGSFTRVNPVRVFAFMTLLSIVLGGAAYGINLIRFSGSASNSSPRIRQNKVPKVPPPVFR